MGAEGDARIGRCVRLDEFAGGAAGAGTGDRGEGEGVGEQQVRKQKQKDNQVAVRTGGYNENI